ncbi:hypothetical protein vseg_003409 [Gypsophila vaccaria]
MGLSQDQAMYNQFFQPFCQQYARTFELREYIDDTEDLINIKLANVQNQLIQFEFLLTAATFVAAIFTVVAGVFGMNF